MRALFPLFAGLALFLLVLSISACADVNESTGMSHITCYSGGQMIVDAEGFDVSTFDNVVIYTGSDRQRRRIVADCITSTPPR